MARVNAQLGRDERTAAPLERALEQMSGVPVRRTLRRQWAAGHVPSQAAWRWTARREPRPLPATPPAGWGVPSRERGRRLADPTALAALVTPELPRAQGPGSRCGLTGRMTLVSWPGPVSVWGRWCGVHQTTIGRGVLGRALAWWPRMSRWVGERVHASRVSVDETGLKSRGPWPSWGVVLAVPTALPVLAARLPSRGQWAGRGVGRPRRQRNNGPQGLLTDG